jgi:hypothetical protein
MMMVATIHMDAQDRMQEEFDSPVGHARINYALSPDRDSS